MKKIVHRANDRGIQDHGWLKAAHSFSFAQYHNPSKMHFGLLRVLNDDIVSPGMGFGTHGHDNMEIVTIPLKGSLAHKDSLGSIGNISSGEVQMMSAGSGIQHSEFNGSSIEEVNLLQIWVLPKERNINPRYDQQKYNLEDNNNSFVTLVSSEKKPGVMWINQDSVFSLGTFDTVSKANYTIKHSGNGAYIFLIEGEIEIDGIILEKRDALGVYHTDSIDINIRENSKILIIEVPME
ncbi:pirin family protein [Daejeonella sp.]|uniref:pirin family protein n=1 Tax=Daejeonella sp. TaxID=2805397 RepID=UPI00398335BB